MVHRLAILHLNISAWQIAQPLSAQVHQLFARIDVILCNIDDRTSQALICRGYFSIDYTTVCSGIWSIMREVIYVTSSMITMLILAATLYFLDLAQTRRRGTSRHPANDKSRIHDSVVFVLKAIVRFCTIFVIKWWRETLQCIISRRTVIDSSNFEQFVIHWWVFHTCWVRIELLAVYLCNKPLDESH